MAAIQTGRQGAIFKEDAHDFDPQYGDTYTQTWHGPKRAIMSKGAQFRAAGWRVSRRKVNGATYQIVATIGTAPGQAPGSGSEVPLDRWRIVTENATLDIRNNPLLIDIAGTSAALAKIFVDANDWLNDTGNVGKTVWDGDAFPAGDATRRDLADLVARGQTSFQQRRPVLSRVRSVSANYPSQFIMSAVQVIFTTAALVRVFGVPDRVRIRLPANPPIRPSNTEWGWFWNQQDSDIIPVINRVEEIDTWIFGAWSTLSNSFIS